MHKVYKDFKGHKVHKAHKVLLVHLALPDQAAEAMAFLAHKDR